jgi:alpha-1,3-rhamnosyl/mannosyltransferase
MMRVGMEGNPVPSRSAGIGAYVRGLARALAAEHDVELTVLVPFKARERLKAMAGRLDPADRIDLERAREGLGPGAAQVRYDLAHALCHYADSVLPPLDLIYRDLDVFHGASFYVPPFRSLPSIATIHDLGFARFPGTGIPGIDMARASRWARRAARIIAVSEDAARDVREMMGVPASKVVAVPNGFDPSIFEDGAQEKDLAALDRMDVLAPYLLHVGTIEPRKNIGTLLALMRRLSEDRPGLRLVLAGRYGWRSEDTIQEIRRAQAAGLVRWLGPLSRPDIAALYRQAEVFVFPSLHEGFGFPVLEAMASGTPVVCARNSSLPEVAGEAALFVDDPLDVAAIGGSVTRLLDDAGLREEMVDRGRENVRRFSWERAASLTAEVYREVAG